MDTDLFDREFITHQKRKVMANAKTGGCTCPVCDQFVKVYKRKINSFMAYHLIKALNTFEFKEFHISDLMGNNSSGGDFSKLRYWGLISEAVVYEKKDVKRTSGKWNLTIKGMKFARNEIRLYKYALIYNSELLGFDETETASIVDALNDKFNYKELMRL